MTDEPLAPLPATHSRAALHDALDALLDAMPASAAPVSPEQVEAFWRFVAGLAGGRGVDAFYHAEGQDAAELAPASPKATLPARQERNAHAALLARLLIDVGGDTKAAGPLPGWFRHGTVAADLLWMVEGGPFGNKQKPQILFNPSQSNDGIRRMARETAVMEIARRKGATGRTLISILNHFGITKQQWDGWVRQGGLDEKATAAQTRAKADPAGAGLTDDELRERIAEARKTGKGRATE